MTEVEALQEVLKALKAIIWICGAGIGMIISYLFAKVFLRNGA